MTAVGHQSLLKTILILTIRAQRHNSVASHRRPCKAVVPDEVDIQRSLLSILLPRTCMNFLFLLCPGYTFLKST